MAKPNPLQAALASTKAKREIPVQQSQTTEPANVPAAPPEPAKRPKSRVGTVLIGGHFAREVAIALKMIALEQDTTIQALLSEGLDLILAKHGKPQIASLTATQK